MNDLTVCLQQITDGAKAHGYQGDTSKWAFTVDSHGAYISTGGTGRYYDLTGGTYEELKACLYGVLVGMALMDHGRQKVTA